ASTIEHKGHGPVVQQLDMHVCGKNPCFYMDSMTAETCRDLLVESLSFFRWCCLLKARATAIRRPAHQRKLRNQQNRSSDVHQRAVHLSVFIRKNSKSAHLFDEIPAVRFSVAFCHT